MSPQPPAKPTKLLQAHQNYSHAPQQWPAHMENGSSKPLPQQHLSAQYEVCEQKARQGVPHSQGHVLLPLCRRSEYSRESAAARGQAKHQGRAAENTAAMTHHSCDARPQLRQQDRVDSPVRCGRLRITQARLRHGLHLVIQLQPL